MAKATWYNIKGTWVKMKNVWENVGNGVWKQKVVPKINVTGTWKDCIVYNGLLYYYDGAYSTGYYLYRINPDGVQDWNVFLGLAQSVKLRSKNNSIYVGISDINYHYSVRKYTLEGNIVWEVPMADYGTIEDFDVDSQDNIYVSNYSRGLIKITLAGKAQWQTMQPNGYSLGHSDICVNNDNSIYFTGYQFNCEADATGKLIWFKSYGPNESSWFVGVNKAVGKVIHLTSDSKDGVTLRLYDMYTHEEYVPYYGKIDKDTALIDNQGNIYLKDFHTIYKRDPTGMKQIWLYQVYEQFGHVIYEWAINKAGDELLVDLLTGSLGSPSILLYLCADGTLRTSLSLPNSAREMVVDPSLL